MAVKKAARKTAVRKTNTPTNVEETPDVDKPTEVAKVESNGVGPLDVSVEVSLVMRDSSGDAVRTENTLTFHGARCDALLRQSHQQVSDFVERLMVSRFLNSVRLYFDDELDRKVRKTQTRELQDQHRRLMGPSTDFESIPSANVVEDDTVEEREKIQLDEDEKQPQPDLSELDEGSDEDAIRED